MVDVEAAQNKRNTIKKIFGDTVDQDIIYTDYTSLSFRIELDDVYHFKRRLVTKQLQNRN